MNLIRQEASEKAQIILQKAKQQISKEKNKILNYEKKKLDEAFIKKKEDV